MTEKADPGARKLTDRDVPERPALADGVELVGQEEDSAFEDPPWLVNRGGAFIHLSELLYRVAERCDGEQSLAEIAESLGSESRAMSARTTSVSSCARSSFRWPSCRWPTAA